ncbi:hypothetical protein [Ideonella alba]|uniref:ABC transporter substrate-binding protein n=1 Tax=Ideonella alba TaxID=2824118 RepID=A0A941BKI7_9BURK|nr:hypothetical protein [Ideonella alba]MBQ0930169.1 hypothetical protein [Ideonella alba]
MSRLKSFACAVALGVSLLSTVAQAADVRISARSTLAAPDDAGWQASLSALWSRLTGR